jgi:hypothetical protein
VHPRALEVIRAVGAPDMPTLLKSYLADVPGLKAQYDAARDMQRIPITLPNGDPLTLSPGGQNVLIKQMVEDFCSYYTPGGHVLYLGDADAKRALFEESTLAGVGVTVDQHGKMPDLVVYLPHKNWLVLLEAASSHGPVDAKRHGELAELFANSTAGLVYVSCFPSRAEMRKYLAEIAWETEVWCADNPTHLIHFNGDRFLGPYKVRENDEELERGVPYARDRLRLVRSPLPGERFVSCVPLMNLRIAAGGLGDPQHIGDKATDWVAVDDRRLDAGMFVAQVVGQSMQPRIPDGSYCLFRGPVTGTRQGKVVLVELLDDVDPETSEILG